MPHRVYIVGLAAAFGLLLAGDLLACGDKFLVTSRGTRYQRPKDARAASILIYANPTSGLPDTLKRVRVESVLKKQGHRSTTVETIEQLTAILASGRFDVVLAAGTVRAAVEQLLGAQPDAAVLVAVDAPPKERSLLQAIDKAVEQRDKSLRKAQTRS